MSTKDGSRSPTAAPAARVSKRSVERFIAAHESVSPAVHTEEVRTPEDEARFAALQTAIGLAMADLPDDPGSALWVPEDPIVSQIQSFMAEQADAATGSAPPPEEVKYDDHDLAGWATSFFNWWRKIVKHPFIPATGASVTDIPNQARLALFGDWGSGRYGAPVVASTIQEMTDRLDAIIHLGDTYYSGTPTEMANHLQAIWPRRADARSFTLNGNHEMYGGGIGYFKVLGDFGQPSSYFALRNDRWLVVGLDSAYRDHSLYGNQSEWLEQLGAADAGKRRIILLTHHQPFSAFEKGGPALVAALLPLLSAGRIHAWFWGHEHRLAIYDAHPGWGLRGRCVGHGGYPYFKVSNPGGWDTVTDQGNSKWLRFPAATGHPGGIVLVDDNPWVIDDPERYGAHGFMTLALDGERATEEYRRPDGPVIHSAPLAP